MSPKKKAGEKEALHSTQGHGDRGLRGWGLPGEKVHSGRAKGRSEWVPALGEKRRLLWEVRGSGS